MSEPKVSDLLRATFGKFADVWVERNGVTTTGKRPAYLDQPSHTAAEMGPKWVPMAKGGK